MLSTIKNIEIEHVLNISIIPLLTTLIYLEVSRLKYLLCARGASEHRRRCRGAAASPNIQQRADSA